MAPLFDGDVDWETCDSLMDFRDFEPRLFDDFETDESFPCRIAGGFAEAEEKLLSFSELIGLQIQLGANLSTDRC